MNLSSAQNEFLFDWIFLRITYYILKDIDTYQIQDSWESWDQEFWD